MADFQGALPVKTSIPGGVVAAIIDVASSNQLALDSNGAVGVHGAVSATVSGTVAVSGLSSGTNTLVIDTNGAALVSGTMTLGSGAQVEIINGSNTLALDSNGAIKVGTMPSVTVTASSLDIRPLTATNDAVTVSGSVSVSSLPALTVSNATVAIGNGANTLAIDSNGAIMTSIVPAAQTEVYKYDTGTAVTNTGTKAVDYVVTSGKTFIGTTVLSGSRGATKAQVALVDGTNVTNVATYFQLAGENNSVGIESIKLLGNGTNLVRLTITNLDDTTDLYGTIQGIEK